MPLVHLNRALSKLGVLTRSQATQAILGGRVAVNGRVVRDPAAAIDISSARIELDGQRATKPGVRTILFHKPRGVVTTRRDPDGRKTVYDVLGDAARGLAPVGRLDLATSGLLLLTNDTGLAHWLTDPANEVPRIYIATVRGKVTPEEIRRLTDGIWDGPETLRAARAAARKISNRESHLTIELREGRNREIRRLFKAIGHEVTRLKRVAFGALQLDDLEPGQWREVSAREIRRAFPRAQRSDHEAPVHRTRGGDDRRSRSQSMIS